MNTVTVGSWEHDTVGVYQGSHQGTNNNLDGTHTKNPMSAASSTLLSQNESPTVTSTFGINSRSAVNTNGLLNHHHQPHHHHRPEPQPPVSTKQCAACGLDIVDRFLLHTMNHYWHVGCLKCSCCQVALGDVGTTCFTRAGMTLCKTDYIRLFGSSGTCSACRLSIPPNELVMRTQGSVYHVTCFACATCHVRLVPGNRYGIVNGRLICEYDYMKLVKSTSPSRTSSSHQKV